MSLNINVRKATETTGGEAHKLPDAGDNGNQEIDTKAEAEAALTLVTSDDLVAVVGGKTYKRADLIKIRDDNSAAAGASAKATATVEDGGDKKRDKGVSLGVALEGSHTWGTGDQGQDGNGLKLLGRLRLPILEKLLAARFEFGGSASSASRKLNTPGGEEVESKHTEVGAVIGAHAAVTPPILNDRFTVSLGVRGGVASFWTPTDGVLTLPAACVPGDFGRGECEPSAGPKTGPAGNAGLFNPNTGGVRETSGALFSLSIPLLASVAVLRGETGSLEVYAGGSRIYKWLSPKDGHGISYPGWEAILGVAGDFGGEQAYVSGGETKRPDKDGDGVPDGDDKCDNTPAGTTVDATGCPVTTPTPAPVAAPYAAKVMESSASVKPEGRFAVAVEVSEKSEVTVQFKDAAGKLYNAGNGNVEKGQAVSEFRAPSTLSSGKYKLVITMKDPVTKAEKVEEREIAIVERIEWTVPGSFAPGQAPAAQDVKVVGQAKLEGVSYVIAAFDKDGKEVGKVSVAKPGTIEDKKGTRIAFQAPDINGKAVGWQKDINYKVALLNKDGNVLDVKSFDAAPLPAAPKGGGGRKRL